MNVSATDVRFVDDNIWLSLDDGRTLGVPLAWFPRLLLSQETDRLKVEISPGGVHWPDLDEDISIAGLLAGRGDCTLTRPAT